MIIICPNCGCKYNLTRKPPVTFHCRKCSFTIPFNILLNESNNSPSIASTNSENIDTTNVIPQSPVPVGESTTIVNEKTRIVAVDLTKQHYLRFLQKTQRFKGKGWKKIYHTHINPQKSWYKVR